MTDTTDTIDLGYVLLRAQGRKFYLEYVRHMIVGCQKWQADSLAYLIFKQEELELLVMIESTRWIYIPEGSGPGDATLMFRRKQLQLQYWWKYGNWNSSTLFRRLLGIGAVGELLFGGGGFAPGRSRTSTPTPDTAEVGNPWVGAQRMLNFMEQAVNSGVV